MKIGIILCACAMLSTVTFASDQRKVPKTEVCTVNDDLHLNGPVMSFSLTAYDAVDVIILNDRIEFAEAISLKAATLKVFKALDAEIFFAYSFEGKKDPGWKEPDCGYKSPDVDLSYRWKYQHFHSC